MRSSLLLLALAACGTPQADSPEQVPEDLTSSGLLGDGLLYPFPNAQLMRDSHIAIPPALLPTTDTPFPIESVAWRTGFSPVQTSVVPLAGVNADALPSWKDATPGVGGVRLVDLTDGAYLPVAAEVDAYCLATEPDGAGRCAAWPDDAPALLVRPQAAMPVGHHVAVVVTTEAAPRPERFEALVNGQAPDDFAHRATTYRDLLTAINDAVALPAEQIALAWDFPVGDGTRPLASAIAASTTPPAWSVDFVREGANGDPVATNGFRAISAHFTSDDFLDGDLFMHLDEAGDAASVGTTSAPVWVHIPASVAHAPAGSVPILVAGHGIFEDGRSLLDFDPDSYSPITLAAEQLGYIVVATDLRGLDWNDRASAFDAARNFALIQTVPDRMAQGQVNTRALIRLVQDPAFTQSPELQGADGQALVDPTRVDYWGVSMGGILGGVTLGSGAPIGRGVHHITGSTWSVLMERSSYWPLFESFLVTAVPRPRDRQLLYAASQLWWDEVDPVAWPGLADAHILVQENLGDEAVTNLGTTILARTLNLPVLAPPLEPPPGLAVVEGPIDGSALVQLDPMRGRPTDWNRPSDVSGIHGASFYWSGAVDQSIEFLRSGQVKHLCGDAPCQAGNTGP